MSMSPRASAPARPPRRPSARPDARAILDRLSSAYPGATTELHFRDAFELLVATILSAQSTDARVNQVTPALFARYRDAAALASADLADVERLVQPTGFFRVKARAIVNMAQRLAERHGGAVPSSMEALTALPGVGRKTANVVLGHALGVPGLPVDRHVLRVAGRLGIARKQTPEEVEQELCSQLPSEAWTLASDCLILHGRRVCRPRPLCHTCMVSAHCLFFRTAVVNAARPGAGQPKPAAPVARSPARSAGSARASAKTSPSMPPGTRPASPARPRATTRGARPAPPTRRSRS
jgi:endonuclease-3